MPDPHKSESHDEFVSRYMASEEARKTYPNEKQRMAVAYSKYREFRRSGTS